MKVNQFMKKLLIALFFSTLSINSYGAGRAPTNAELKAIKAKVTSNLKDPDSAKVTDIRVNKDGYVCGMVNGKNSYGAYVGKKPFMGILATGLKKESFFYVVGIGATESDEEYFYKTCAEKFAD